MNQGWPNDKEKAPKEVCPYFSFQEELSCQDEKALNGERAVIPDVLRREITQHLHSSRCGMMPMES